VDRSKYTDAILKWVRFKALGVPVGPSALGRFLEWLDFRCDVSTHTAPACLPSIGCDAL